MLDHHLQKKILYSLVTNPTARFAEMKPENVEGNIFTYHLQQLIRQNYVIKNQDGTYGLTAVGKAIGININLTANELLEQAHSIFLIVLRKDDKWLLRKRLAHPMYGRTGFVHGEPNARESLTDAANKALKERTGLTAEYEVIGSAYIKIFQNDDLESFTHCVVLSGYNIKGKLLKLVGNGSNEWVENPNFSAPEMIPSMRDIAKKIDSSDTPFFLELEYHLQTD